jgi:hypothetical protein
MLVRAWSTSMLTPMRRTWPAGDVMLGLHWLRWKHDTVMLFRSCRLMLAAAIKVVGSQRAPGEILHWFLRCRQRRSCLDSLPC